MRTMMLIATGLLALLAGCQEQNQDAGIAPAAESSMDASPEMADTTGGAPRTTISTWEDVPMDESDSGWTTEGVTVSTEAPEPLVSDTTTIVTPPAPQPRTHVVRKGDTLWSLAEEYLGSGRRWQEIAEANPSVNPNKLLVGMQLKIPPK